jgi:hypothetical protein
MDDSAISQDMRFGKNRFEAAQMTGLMLTLPWALLVDMAKTTEHRVPADENRGNFKKDIVVSSLYRKRSQLYLATRRELVTSV